MPRTCHYDESSECATAACQHKAAEVACYRTESKGYRWWYFLTPRTCRGVGAPPISVLKLAKNEVDESSECAHVRTYDDATDPIAEPVVF